MTGIQELVTVLEPRPLPDFVETPFVKAITERALAYIEAGFPVHFRGPSGTGKTTLAMHVAAMIGRPVVLIHGDEEFRSSDLVGGEHGYRYRRVIDRFVSRVLKVEEDMIKRWVDYRLTTACKYGLTLIYDEFTRSRPETNNVLLSILQERVLELPVGRGEDPYLRVHPDFIYRLMEMEIEEIFKGLVEVVRIVREPGERAKVAVYSKSPHIDPVGACVGVKGT
ncbi:MAG: AAA family ATPase, partial [Candidatus Methylomirabilales bacterium]